MRNVTVALLSALAALAGAPAAAADPVDIGGLNQPVAVEVLPDGRVYIAEKTGTVKYAPSLEADGATTVLDISDRVASHNDHGLTTVAYTAGHLYALYTGVTPDTIDDSCETYLTSGCPIPGFVSRWPVTADGSLGPEEILRGGELGPGEFCMQYATHGMDNIEIAPNGNLVVSTGDGAGVATGADVGQTPGPDGTPDPCGHGGALRPQSDDSPMGKVLELDPDTGDTVRILAKGLRNPFRSAFLGDELYTTDTGWYSFEEINHVADEGRNNFGWPCYEGELIQYAYDSQDAAPCESLYAAPDRPGEIDPPSPGAEPVVDELKFEPCAEPFPRLAAGVGAFDRPAFCYGHPEDPSRPDGTFASISALAGGDGRLWLGDYTQRWIDSVRPDGSDRRRELEGVFPVDLHQAPDGRLVYVDIALGAVRTVADAPGGDPDPGPGETTAELTFVDGWAGGQALPFSVDSNLLDPNVRQPPTIAWKVMLLTGCEEPSFGCEETPLDFKLADDDASGSTAGPDLDEPAFIRIDVTVTSASGTSSASDSLVAGNDLVGLITAPAAIDAIVASFDLQARRIRLDDGRLLAYDEGDFLEVGGRGEWIVSWERELDTGDRIQGQVAPGGQSRLDLPAAASSERTINGHVTAVDLGERRLTLSDGETYAWDDDDFLELNGAGEWIVKWERALTVGSRMSGTYAPGSISRLDLVPARRLEGMVTAVDIAAREFTLSDGGTYAYDAGDFLRVSGTGEWIVNWERSLTVGDTITGSWMSDPSERSELDQRPGLPPPPGGSTPTVPTAVDGTIDAVDRDARLVRVGDLLIGYGDDDYLSIDGAGEWIVKWEQRLAVGRRLVGTFRPGAASELDLVTAG